MQRPIIVLVMAMLLCIPITASAVTTIEAGDHFLPNVPGLYELPIYSHGTDLFAGVELFVYTGSGGALDLNDGPKIQSVTVTRPDMIFGQDNTGEPGNVALDQFAVTGTTTNNTFLTADGMGNLLATVTVDTTTLGPGEYPFIVSGGGAFDFPPSNLYASSVVAVGLAIDGTITIVPEPSSVVLGLFAAAALGQVMMRRRRKLTAQ